MTRFHQISSILVALLFVYAINFKSFVTISYFANQSEIIALFCVNKEKPKMNCNGKCHLATQLDKVEEDKDIPFSESAANISLEISPILVCCLNDFKPTVLSKEKNDLLFNEGIVCKGYTNLSSPPPKA